MKLQFTFKHLDSSEALQAHTQEFMNQIEGYLLKESKGHVTFSKIKNEFLVEIDVHSKEKHFHAKAHCDNPYVGVNKAINKLERQFLKTKSIYQNHKRFELSKSGRLRQAFKKAA